MPAAEFLYDRVADDLAALIERGALRPGDRLPSVRALSRQHRISVATVVQAYQTLETRGLVEARPQSGHYVRPRPAGLPPEPRVVRSAAAPAPVAIGDLVARVYGAVRDPALVPLGAATLGRELLPADKLNRMLARIARSAGAAGVSYDPPPGLPALRRAVARRAAGWGCALRADDLVTTVGCMEAIALSLRAVTRAGDAVAVESPAYYGLLQLLESLGLRVVEVPAHPRTGMDVDELGRVLGTCRLAAVVATPNFNNPLGGLMPDAAKQHLVDLLARHEVPLVEDDIYGDLHFGPGRPRPAKAFDRRGLVLLCSSFSKTLAPGYRVGFCAPGRFRERVERLKFAHSVATPTLPQMAIAEFLTDGGYDRHLRGLRGRLAAQVARTIEAIGEHFPAGTRVSRPLGGFVLWVELPGGADALALHAAAWEHGISIAPGPIFSAGRRFAGCVRLNCGQAGPEVVDHALRTLGRLAASV